MAIFRKNCKTKNKTKIFQKNNDRKNSSADKGQISDELSIIFLVNKARITSNKKYPINVTFVKRVKANI